MKATNTIPLWGRAPRNSIWITLALALVLAIALVSPIQLPVVLYKVALVALAAVLGYWLDRVLFPYARPDSYLVYDWRYGSTEPEGKADYPVTFDHVMPFCAAMLRRALIVCAVVVGVTQGL